MTNVEYMYCCPKCKKIIKIKYSKKDKPNMYHSHIINGKGKAYKMERISLEDINKER